MCSRTQNFLEYDGALRFYIINITAETIKDLYEKLKTLPFALHSRIHVSLSSFDTDGYSNDNQRELLP